MTPIGAVVFVVVIAAVIFCPWYIGLPLCFVYNGFCAYRAHQAVMAARHIQAQIEHLEAENRSILDKHFR